ncbi:MAG: hypothetical protein GX575_19040 [Candidatus Anammoximicrobium sp.]|nr:hypothetical protein [Candidatus Anammoximicrobium sp.]
MAKTSDKKADKVELPEVPLEQFEAGVRALAELRDRGKFLIFLGRKRSAQFVGDVEVFRAELSSRQQGQELSPEETKEVLDEIRRHLSARVNMGSSEAVVTMFTRMISGDRLKDLKGAAKEQFREQVEKKAALVAEQLFTEALRTRSLRLNSATAACLEELDFEIVEERLASSRNERVDTPFVRLKIRYSKGTEAQTAFLRIFFGEDIPLPFPQSGLESFELECDESDIDLLMLRLDAAKKRLLTTHDNESEVENG